MDNEPNMWSYTHILITYNLKCLCLHDKTPIKHCNMDAYIYNGKKKVLDPHYRCVIKYFIFKIMLKTQHIQFGENSSKILVTKHYRIINKFTR